MTITYLTENKHDDVFALGEEVKLIHPGCDLELIKDKNTNRMGWRIRINNGREFKYADRSEGKA